MEITINTKNLTDEQRVAFIAGWENAGGTVDDEETSMPWYAPWFYRNNITVEGHTPEEWGASWWDKCRDEIEESD